MFEAIRQLLAHVEHLRAEGATDPDLLTEMKRQIGDVLQPLEDLLKSVDPSAYALLDEMEEKPGSADQAARIAWFLGRVKPALPTGSVAVAVEQVRARWAAFTRPIP